MTPTDPERSAVQQVREALAGWIRENGPGGWIDELRRQLVAAEARAQQLEAALKEIRELASQIEDAGDWRGTSIIDLVDELVVRADTQEPPPAPKLIERVDWSSVSYQVSSICEARTPGHRCWRTAGHTGDHDWVLTEEKPTP